MTGENTTSKHLCVKNNIDEAFELKFMALMNLGNLAKYNVEILRQAEAAVNMNNDEDKLIKEVELEVKKAKSLLIKKICQRLTFRLK
jgi:hypothetical protein